MSDNQKDVIEQSTSKSKSKVVEVTTMTTENKQPVLSEELQKAYDTLTPDSAAFYHNLNDNDAKISYLKTIVSTRQNERKKG
ncbi:2881_t:CDS:2, partial [Scutellospora calospora]